jgi:hypothetical protein
LEEPCAQTLSGISILPGFVRGGVTKNNMRVLFEKEPWQKA